MQSLQGQAGRNARARPGRPHDRDGDRFNVPWRQVEYYRGKLAVRYRFEVLPDEVDMPVGYVAGIRLDDRPRLANVVRQPILGLRKFD